VHTVSGKVRAFAILILLAVPTALAGRNMHFELPFLVVVDNKYGYMDASCRMVIPARFDEAFDFTEGLAAVKTGDKWGYVSPSGQFVITPRFAGAFQFADGLASVRIDENSMLWGFIDRTGKIAVRPQFGTPLWFSEGLVEGYGEENGILNVPLGYVDKSGGYVIRLDEQEMRIEFLVGFSEGLARVSMQPQHADGSVGPSRWGYIDHTGKWVIPRAFMGAGDFHEGLAAVTGTDGIWGYIDTTGQFAIAPHFEAAKEFSEGLASVRAAGKWGFIDKTGTMAIPPQFEEVSGFEGAWLKYQAGERLVT
jgi:hypothetical protein